MIGIIVGSGRIGFNLAQRMSEKHDITIIEKNKRFCEKAEDTLDCYVIHGTGTNTKILEDAEIAKADFFVAATANDEVNLLSSVYAKEKGVKKIVSRLNDIDHEEIFKKLKIKTINPETSAMRYIARNIVRPTAQSLVSIGEGNAEIMELKVKNKEVLDIPIDKLENNTDKFKIITVYTDNKSIIPTSETKLKYEDSIAIIVKTKYLKETRKLFTKE